MRIAVIGKSGQLARSLAFVADDLQSLVFFGKEDIDLFNEEAIYERLSAANCGAVINCSAYTAVDRAEDEPAQAFALNVSAVENLVAVCLRINAFFIHISTDYVFDGTSNIPYEESAICSPQSVYGRTKRLGEISVLESGVSGLVVRTSWLYSPFGKNFYKTIRQRLEDRVALKIVDDQIGVPTSSLDLARVLLTLSYNGKIEKYAEVLNVSNNGPTTWYEFAKAIAKGIDCEGLITPVSSSHFITKARRPAYSVLSTLYLKDKFCINMRLWHSALNEVLSLPLS